MNVLVIGHGARMHALVLKFRQQGRAKKIYCVPGNAGTAEIAENVALDTSDFEQLSNFAIEKNIVVTIVAPETPLVNGIVDVFEKKGLFIFGPRKKAAQIEGSKIFCNDLLQKYEIPSPQGWGFSDFNKAIEFLQEYSGELVVKADGLAAGKGVIVAETQAEVTQALHDFMVKKKFGKASEKVLLQEKLRGFEVSVMVFTDGKNFVSMPFVQDHKRLLDNDLGWNTGGMGAYAPIPLMDALLKKEIDETIIGPTLDALRKEGAEFRGVLYAGLMIHNNKPYVLEYNCRLGDPEAQVVLALLESDLLEIIEGCCKSKLSQVQVKWKNDVCVCVVLASPGYPEKPEIGKQIFGLDSVFSKNIEILHAATIKKDGQFFSNGGRVLNVIATAPNLAQAITDVYAAVSQISFEGMQYRKDIGKKGLKQIL
ncbi:MAG: phosphoribosylamine--glycine ligase [Candidatus Diapherotrites archaeon]|nr:phosphoribosylamine--glycine ligase [Candidatus Diapherotrites archaeon]